MNNKKPFSIGADVGGTNLRAALVDNNGNILEKIKTSSQNNAVETLTDAIDKLFTKEVKSIGLAIAGLIDNKSKTVIQSPNLRMIENIDLIDILSKKYNVPVNIGNDANLAALGESIKGAGANCDSFILLTLGTGIGGGIVLNSALVNAAAELGHIIIAEGGRVCGCFNKGCLEAYASSTAIVKSAKHKITAGTSTSMVMQNNNITPEYIYNSAVNGDSLALELLKEAGYYLGIGIGSMINIFSPDAVILTGGLVGAWDIYVEAAIDSAKKTALAPLFTKTKIIPAQLPDDAGLIGASYLAYV
ncbi:ROK family protein [Candidatus Magnetoovum chiemensis]|nr:ROK family protein [Candidatus Magnetoovum chiemensis]